eukprot:144135_1
MASEHNENKDNTTTATTVELQPSTLDEPKNDDINAAKSIEEMQKMLLKSQPSLIDVMNKKTSWKEFLSFYNILRISIASIFGVFIYLCITAFAYLLNPNSCKMQRTNPNRLQWQPFANIIRTWFTAMFCAIPILKIFGPHWLWSTKKINTLIFIVGSLSFIALMPYPFLLNIDMIVYFLIASSIFAILIIVYTFISDGFFLFWFLFPFQIMIIILFAVLYCFGLLFINFIPPATSPFFGVTYTFMLTLLQSISLKYTAFQFPYKWGKCCTCPWNKNKKRLQNKYNNDENGAVTLESVLSDLVIYYISMVFISCVEAMRVSAYVAVKGSDQRWEMVQLIISSIIFECIARNNLFWELIYKIILKKPLPGWGRVYSIYYGAKYQSEYIPIGCIFLMNVFNYGPFKECGRVRDGVLNDNVNIGSDLWWLTAVMIMTEALSHGIAEIVLRIGRYFKWFGVKNENGEDPPRETILVKVSLFPMMWIVVHCYITATFCFGLERMLLQGSLT